MTLILLDFYKLFLMVILSHFGSFYNVQFEFTTQKVSMSHKLVAFKHFYKKNGLVSILTLDLVWRGSRNPLPVFLVILLAFRVK